MDPLTAIGGIAASSQLLSETVKSVNAAYKTVQSFHSAPKELEQVAQKLACARDRIQQIQAFGNDLSNADMDDLFPLAHRTLLFTALNKSMDAFSRLRSLKDATDKNSFRIKLSWAALDKRQVGHITDDLSETERILDQTLAIFNARLGTLNRTSLGALRVGQLAMETTGVRIETSIANVELMGTNTMSQIQENTMLVQTNRALLQKNLDEHRTNQQQMESMLSMQMKLLQDMQDLKASMALPAPIHNVAEDNPVIPNHQTKSAKLSQELPRVTSRSIQSSSYHSSRETTVMEWGFGEYHLDAWSAAPIGQHGRKIDASTRSPASPLATKLRLKRRTKGKRTDIQARVNLSVLGSRILQAELRIRVVATAWFSLPFIETTFTTINVRPGYDPIFEAIDDLNFKMIRELLESGEASIHDVSAGDGKTLLGKTLVTAPSTSEPDNDYERQRQLDAEKIVAYLLREGCDPNIQAHTVRQLPSLLSESFLKSNNAIARLLYNHGADPDWTPLYEFTSWKSTSVLRSQLEMIDTWGVVDWSGSYEDITKYNIVVRLCRLGDPDLVVLHLEDGNLDIDGTLGQNTTPLQMALTYNKIELASVFLAYGATTGPPYDPEGKPQDSTLRHALRRSDALSSVHLLLFHDANPGNTWDDAFGWTFRNHCLETGKWFVYDELVGAAAHMLFHNASCNFIPSERFALITADMNDFQRQYFHAKIELNEFSQKEVFWTTRGAVCLDGYDNKGRLFSRERLEALGVEYEKRTLDHDEFVQHTIKYRRRDFNADTEEEVARRMADSVCYGKTGFEDIISTRRDCQRLAKYPLAMAYWSAVNLAGYRAEIDDDGDIWWSDDDVDRYFDAREEQPAADEEDGVIQNCPMCQDPEKWGLKSIKDREAAGLKAIDDYRKRKAKVVWPKTYS